MKTLNLCLAVIPAAMLCASAWAADEKADKNAPAAGPVAAKPATMPAGAPMGAPGMMGPAMGMTNVSPDQLRKVMQYRSDLDDLTRKIQARQAKLYEDNARIKELQGKMLEMQKQIDEELAKDDELAKLKKNLDSQFNAPMPRPQPGNAVKKTGDGQGAAKTAAPAEKK